MVRKILVITAVILAPVMLQAQGVTGIHPAYVRAQAMVNDGNTAAGRAVVDSMIAIAAPGSNEYAEGVYWRAVLAATAADAEMDYRRIVVDYPRSPRVEDALIRLAQLEIARANYDGALRHLNRLVAEHPDSPARARAGYWMARAMFDKNDVQGGCVATADALSRTSENDAELRNQITYLNQRCAGVVIAQQPPATVPLSIVPAPAAAVTPAPVGGVPVNPVVTDSVVTPRVVVPTPAPTPPPPPPPPPPAVTVAPSPVPAPARNDPPASSSETGRAWSVQVAAYNAKSQADAMVATLKKSGYEARVDGTAAPFRVRIGRYATQGQASAVQRSLKAKKIEGFVVPAEVR